jgi:nitrite reductase/ring-hydroxylating ferredoxin subunit
MLSDSDNEILTRTGPGTPMGELFRRFWLPVMVPDEMNGPDSPPVRIKVLSEELIAFRDSDGKVGFVANACPHRGASLFFGRNEENGLRCVYHGWKFDLTGACVDMPSEPSESNFKNKVRVKAYPSAEFGGIVWIYMGPAEVQPELPQYEWATRGPNPNLKIYKWLQESNYCQGLEGNIDTAHVGFLHRRLNVEGMRGTNPDAAPVLQLQETDFGFYYGGRRDTADGDYYWRVTPFVLPTFTSIPGGTWNGSGLFLVPCDDETTWWMVVSPEGARFNPPGVEYVELVPGTWRNSRNVDNDYGIDREMQRTVNYTGIAGNRAQDGAVTESMGTIYDRSHEHLGTSDTAIIFMRRLLIRQAKRLQQGIEPVTPSDPNLFRVRPVDVVTAEPNLVPVWEKDHAEHMASGPLPIGVAVGGS